MRPVAATSTAGRRRPPGPSKARGGEAIGSESPGGQPPDPGGRRLRGARQAILGVALFAAATALLDVQSGAWVLAAALGPAALGPAGRARRRCTRGGRPAASPQG